MEARQVALVQDHRIEAIRIVRDLAVVSGIGSRNREPRHDDNLSVDLSNGALHHLIPDGFILMILCEIFFEQKIGFASIQKTKA